MKHVIIGTAGHVDHGKTRLIRALTGEDPDRLPEEKKRGITIEPGFAQVEFEDGTRAGIVDVPGHEKLVKNMLMGACGVDIALLVVAADQGVMPQTREHVNILSLLGVKTGLVALTKTDAVEPELAELAAGEVRAALCGSFLEGCPVLPVSARTGQGMEALKAALQTLVGQAAARNPRIPFRLPVDRVFSAEGFGTVVTGTLTEGCIHRGDSARLLPEGTRTVIRNLQVHGKNVEAAAAGQRLALNLAGVKKEEACRGQWVCFPDSIRCSRVLDVKIEILPDSGRNILTGSRLHLYLGAAVRLCRITLTEGKELAPGQQGYARLRLDKPAAVRKGDRFVVRFYSPVETVGGGVVLDEEPPAGRPSPEALQVLESGEAGQQILQLLEEYGKSLPEAGELARKLGREPEEVAAVLEELVCRGQVLEPLPGRYLSGRVLDQLFDGCRQLLEQYHRANPLHAGMMGAELGQKLLRDTDPGRAAAILKLLVREGRLKTVAGRYALADFRVQLTRRQRQLRDRILQICLEAGVQGITAEELERCFPREQAEDCRQVTRSLIIGTELVILPPRILFCRQTLQKAAELAEEWFQTRERLTLAQFRDLLGTSRRCAEAILDWFDRNKMTRRIEDYRIAGPVGFEKSEENQIFP